MDTVPELKEFVLLALGELEPYVYHTSSWGSVYIKFPDQRIGSLRIADHPSRKHYRYRWNLLLKLGDHPGSVKKGKVTRWYYSKHSVDHMVYHILNYAAAIHRKDRQQEQRALEDRRYA